MADTSPENNLISFELKRGMLDFMSYLENEHFCVIYLAAGKCQWAHSGSIEMSIQCVVQLKMVNLIVSKRCNGCISN